MNSKVSQNRDTHVKYQYSKTTLKNVSECTFTHLMCNSLDNTIFHVVTGIVGSYLETTGLQNKVLQQSLAFSSMYSILLEKHKIMSSVYLQDLQLKLKDTQRSQVFICLPRMHLMVTWNNRRPQDSMLKRCTESKHYCVILTMITQGLHAGEEEYMRKLD